MLLRVIGERGGGIPPPGYLLSLILEILYITMPTCLPACLSDCLPDCLPARLLACRRYVTTAVGVPPTHPPPTALLSPILPLCVAQIAVSLRNRWMETALSEFGNSGYEAVDYRSYEVWLSYNWWIVPWWDQVEKPPLERRKQL